jgi:drug/metabolite transporter (DMT)-like permease
MHRTSPLAIAAFAVVGLAGGLLLQFARSSWGQAPFVPPVSLAATLVVIAVVLLVLGIALRRAVTRDSGRPVNPFHAVRLLAGARAGQFAGALFGGFGGGLALQLLTRSVPPPVATWLPMLLVLGAGIVLTVCGVVAEALCRVPPGGPEPGSEPDAGAGPGQDAADAA